MAMSLWASIRRGVSLRRGLSLITVALVVASCSGQDGDPERSQAESIAPAAVPTVVVLDASESMLAEDAPGSRWSAATNAVTTLTDALPDGTDVGIVAFGSTMPAKTTPQSRGCTDVEVVVPLGQTDRQSLGPTLADLRPQGFTPIGAALAEAAVMLPVSESSIVVVSDGESTCAPDPCETAARIRAEHPQTTISAIGFKTDAESLECVAERGGGAFLTADNAEQLTARIAVAQNSQAAQNRLGPTRRGDIEIGEDLDGIVAAHEGFSEVSRKDGDRTIVVWRDCTYVFDENDALIEIAPGDPTGASGTTVDGVAAGTAGSRAVQLYGQPASDSDGTATFTADEGAGTAYRIGYDGGDAVAEGTVRTVVLCKCLAEPGESGSVPVLGRDGYQQYASGFGTVKPDRISMASTASSSFGGITWESWGGEEAVATSRSQLGGPSEPQSELWLMASDLGWCNGVWSYRSLTIAGGRNELGTNGGSDICKGDRSEP